MRINGHSASSGTMFPGAPFDLVAVAASAGGILAMRTVLSGLPAHFPIPIAYVQHLAASYPSQLSHVLGWGSRLTVRFAREHERLRAGTVFVAPPDRHLLVGAERRFDLLDSDKLHYVRPAADWLFTTAADAFGPRVLAIVLTGMGMDGARGAAAIRRNGGMLIVQDPAEAEAPSMPDAAIRTCGADLVLPLEGIAHALNALAFVRGSRELFCAAPAPIALSA